MRRELKFMTCAPDDTYYTWQVHLWLESLKKINKSKDAIVLLFVPKGRNPNTKWKQAKEEILSFFNSPPLSKTS